MKKVLRARSNRQERLVEKISEYFYGSTIHLEGEGIGNREYKVFNKNGEIKGFVVVNESKGNNNKWSFYELQESVKESKESKVKSNSNKNQKSKVMAKKKPATRKRTVAKKAPAKKSSRSRMSTNQKLSSSNEATKLTGVLELASATIRKGMSKADAKKVLNQMSTMREGLKGLSGTDERVKKFMAKVRANSQALYKDLREGKKSAGVTKFWAEAREAFKGASKAKGLPDTI